MCVNGSRSFSRFAQLITLFGQIVEKPAFAQALHGLRQKATGRGSRLMALALSPFGAT
ncbi:hypothetical protein AGR2A_Lc40086 [Agrobacterium genomosp. 2 str. CFBP 5494]|uniref:Uncharacterized protein n=1 Tax=Agrobacterium genomosp. 2 str. CFBP 5494 TaxID=1183436 RepID=A0A9W5F2B5_9HYPH|nr:hypothetical protein AGR2A_Lc40086 [Agrobacterium genomosp. 2 str. CFBP 5494]